MAGPAGFEPVTPGCRPERVKATPGREDALPVLYLAELRARVSSGDSASILARFEGNVKLE